MAFVERRFQAAPTSPINFLLLYDAAVRLWPLAPVIPVLEPTIFALGYTIE
jgi:hypothetical protein